MKNKTLKILRVSLTVKETKKSRSHYLQFRPYVCLVEEFYLFAMTAEDNTFQSKKDWQVTATFTSPRVPNSFYTLNIACNVNYFLTAKST